MEHTPGPWEFYEGDGELWVLQPATGRDIMMGHDQDDDEPWEQWRADAHLISAAPDLLAACEEMYRVVNEQIVWVEDLDDLDSYLQMLGSAIAKAKGENESCES